MGGGLWSRSGIQVPVHAGVLRPRNTDHLSSEVSAGAEEGTSIQPLSAWMSRGKEKPASLCDSPCAASWSLAKLRAMGHGTQEVTVLAESRLGRLQGQQVPLALQGVTATGTQCFS